MIRKIFSFLMIALFAIFFGCSKETEQPESAAPVNNNDLKAAVNESSTTLATTEYTLWAGKTTNVGKLIVSNDNEFVYVTYKLTDATKSFGTLHLWVGFKSQLWFTIPGGRPSPGQFVNHGGFSFSPNASEYTFKVPIKFECKDSVYIVAHGEVGGETFFAGNTPPVNANPTSTLVSTLNEDTPEFNNKAWWYYVVYYLVDPNPPIFNPPILENDTVSCDDPFDWFEPVATDDCDGTITCTFVDVTAPFEKDGVKYERTIRTWTAVDKAGNVATITQTGLRLIDVIPPVLSGQGKDGKSCILEFTSPTATDNCDGDISAKITFKDVIVGLVTTRTWTVTDKAGNTSSVSQSITLDIPSFDVASPLLYTLNANTNYTFDISSRVSNLSLGADLTFWLDASATTSLNNENVFVWGTAGIAGSHTFYIKATSPTGCFVIKPVEIIITLGSVNPTVCYDTINFNTAFGGGKAGAGKSWWFYYVKNSGPQTIWAGQNIDVGTVDVVNGVVNITLNEGWILQDVKEPVKIKGYATIPTTRPSAGLFTGTGTYKGTNTTGILIGDYAFYDIQLDVAQKVVIPCPTTN